MTSRTLVPGTMVRNKMTGTLGTILRWADFASYVVHWENYDFNIHCRPVHFTKVR